jgi:hypothetical protein
MKALIEKLNNSPAKRQDFREKERKTREKGV